MEQELSVDKEFFCRAGHGDLSRVGGYLQLNDYLGDVEPFLRSGVSFNPHQAYAEFKKNVLPLI